VAPAFDPLTAFQALLHRSVDDERYLAANYLFSVANGNTVRGLDLWVLDRATGAAPVHVGENALAVGWGGDAQLYFMNLGALDAGAPSEPGLTLWRYDPAHGTEAVVLSEISFTSVLGWSTDHRSLLVTQALPVVVGEAPRPSVLMLTFGPPPVLRLLARDGNSPVFAPASTAEQGQVAFVRDIFGGEVRSVEVHVMDVATGADRLLFDSAQVGGDTLSSGAQLLWSPGGAWLSFVGFGGTRLRLFTIEAATGQAREWRVDDDRAGSFLPHSFSTDDRYLAAQAYSGIEIYATYALFDLAAGGSAPARHLNGSSLAWAPAGHTLALSNPLGVFLVDAATGDYQWLQAEACALDW